MTFWRSFKVFVARVGFRIRTRSLYYKYWSTLYRFLWNRKYKDVVIPTYHDIADLARVLDTMVWKADGLRELWDACASPQYVQHVIDTDITSPMGDCDEFAIYAATVMNQSFYVPTWMMTVTWMDIKGNFNGHNVCLIGDNVGRYRFMDYGMPSEWRGSLQETVEDVMREYAPCGTCTGYAVQDLDLTPLFIAWGEGVKS